MTMRTPETLATDDRKKKKRKDARFKQERIVDVGDISLQNGLWIEDDSSISSSCSDISCSKPETVNEKKTKIIAIDCEMVGVGPEKKSALARCSMVNYDGSVIYDTFVKPKDKITDYRTQWSGIRSSDMINAIPFRKAKRQARKLLKGRILVGHSLQSDLSVLKLKHPPYSIRDTSKFIPLRTLAGLSPGATPSLKALTRNILHTDIQTSEHCSIEDARASLSLYKHCEMGWENDYMKVDSSSYLGDAFWPSWTNMN